MKKSTILTITLGLLVGIQFIRPDKNISEQPTENDITHAMKLPLEVKEILQISCYDCHSNTTNYPWYYQVAPVSWMIANHINEAKEHLNFSEWSLYNNNQKEHILEDIEDVLTENKMPLKSYLLMHNDGKITDQERQYILEWIALEQMKKELK